MNEQNHIPTMWVPITGRWKFDGDMVVYLGPDPAAHTPYGIALYKDRVKSGSITTTVILPEDAQNASGRILFGYDAEIEKYFTVGLGGHDAAYVLVEFLPTIDWNQPRIGDRENWAGWIPRRIVGKSDNLVADFEYQIQAEIHRQRINLAVNGITVLEHNLPRALRGNQVGLFAGGKNQVTFKNTQADMTRPQAFVVMQFGEPYDSLYTEVIQAVTEKMGLDAYRADDVYQPGVILQDIISGLIEAEVIIAEITPPNPNVFYELGYAHAIDKPTILLAERGRDLPFDISGYRCIFYDNTIRGKNDVENQLRKHLANVL